jgi:hypothetical protein
LGGLGTAGQEAEISARMGSLASKAVIALFPAIHYFLDQIDGSIAVTHSNLPAINQAICLVECFP